MSIAGPWSEISVNGGGVPAVEKTAAGWFVAAASGVRAVLRGYRDGLVCRVAASGDSEVVQLGVGAVTSRLCNALFSPSRDEALVFAGDGLELRPPAAPGAGFTVATSGPLTVTVLTDYFKVHRRLPWFRAMDRKAFPRPPAGWCSWYYYYLDITEGEVVRNTDWLAAHLKPFGCEYVQIDDGWQGRGRGFGTNRDFFVTRAADFPRGMKFCADYIRQRGFRPGLWCIPFFHSNTELWDKEPTLFIRDEHGRSPGERQEPLPYEWMSTDERRYEWSGRYCIDPTSAAGQDHLKRLFTLICDEWGYDYVKIDAQGGCPWLYQQHRPRLADPSVDGDRAYRRGLAAAKAVMGPERFLLNCGAGWSSCGYCEGIRIGGDVNLQWSGIKTAVDCTLDWLWLNTLAFYTDPDVVCVREPLAFEQARVWATLLGITGQLLMASDKMYELPEERVELLRRIFPVADIHPMELYPLDRQHVPGIFDLKVAVPGVGEWDVVAAFNWSEKDPKKLELTPARLGLEPSAYVWFDVFRGNLVHEGTDKLTCELAPTSCRVFSVWRLTGRPQFLGTSRHLTQGAVDVDAVAWDEATLTLSGTSQVVANDAYRVRVYVPDGWRLSTTEDATQYGHLAVLTLRRPKNARVHWALTFARA